MDKHCMKAALVAIAGTILLTLSVALFILLLAFQNAKPSSPCAGQFGPITYLHRGNLTYAQENTLDAIINGTSNNMKNPEMDVTAVNSGEAVLFHDTSMYRMTGIEKDIKDVDLQEALNTTILSEIDGHRYGSTNQIPLMKTAVDAICDEDSTGIGINFDTDTADAIQSTVQALKNSNCKNTSNRTIWSAGYPEVVNAAHKYLKEEKMDNRISIYMPPGEYFFLGLKFFLKTRLLQSVLTSGSSILSLHRTVHDVEQDLIQSWRDDGWCLGIWGIRPEDISNYNVDYYVVDESPIFPDLPFGGLGADGEPKEIVYDDDSLTSYYVLISLACLLMFMSIGFFYIAFRYTYFRKIDDKEFLQEHSLNDVFRDENL